MDIRRINDPNFPWDIFHSVCQMDIWEMMDRVHEITSDEYEYAKAFLEVLKVDVDDECMIEFRAAPSHLVFLAVNIYRRLNLNSSKKLKKNFKRDIEPES